jgi:hypothetical protein
MPANLFYGGTLIKVCGIHKNLFIKNVMKGGNRADEVKKSLAVKQISLKVPLKTLTKIKFVLFIKMNKYC